MAHQPCTPNKSLDANGGSAVTDMTKEQIVKSCRRFELAGAIVSALCFGCILWLMSLDSFRLEPMPMKEWLGVIPYLLLTSICYLGMFWLLDRYFSVPANRIRLNWIAISLLGTALSFIGNNIPLSWKYGLDKEKLLAMSALLFFFNIGMLGIMAFIWSVGFVVRLVRKEVYESRVVLD